MRYVIITFLVGLLAISPFAQSSRSPRSSQLVIRDVSIVDVKTGLHIPRTTVIISGGRISSIGNFATIERGARIINASGKYLVPGLWDMHVHAITRWEWASLLLVANGVTGIRDPGTVVERPELVRMREAIERGKLVQPRFTTSGRQIDGVPKSRSTYIETATPASTRTEVQRSKSDKVDFVKIYTRLSRESFFAAIDEAKKVGIPIDGHVPLSVSSAEASDAGMRTIEHSYRHRMACADAETEIREILLMSNTIRSDEPRKYFAAEDKAFLLGLNTYNSQKCVELGRRFSRNGTWFIPTLVEAQTRFRTEFPDEKVFSDQRLKYVAPVKAAQWRDDILFEFGFLDGQMTFGPRDDLTILDERKREMQNRLKMPFDLQAGGAGILAGTDADTNFPFLFYGFSLHDEMELMVKGGMSPVEALRTATINPARFLRREHELGTVELGKLADLVLLDADPLGNISNSKKIYAVIANGTYLPRPELDRMLKKAETILSRIPK